MKHRHKKLLLFLLLLATALSLCACKKNEQPQPWTPNWDEPWNFTPISENASYIQYDITFSTEFPVYDTSVEAIYAKAVNHTGDHPYIVCKAVFAEKYYNALFPGYNSDPGWVRLPYREPGDSAYSFAYSADNTTGAVFYPQYLQNGCTLTPGKYRLVLCLGDGPHYAYFEITE